jgi:iron complex transport system permease protein
VTALVGAVTLLACTIVAHPPGAELVVPLNVVTSLVGGPVVIAVLLRSNRFAGAAA